jgi:Flp pilus assembly protein TadG
MRSRDQDVMAAIRLIHAIARRLLRAREGIAALEFALAFPIVLTAVMGVVEISMILFVSSLLEGGLRDASRFGITGAVPANGGSREQAIIDMVNDRALGFVTVTPADVTMKVYKCLSDVGKAETLTKDVNGNGKWDPGDTYLDENGNGKWDSDKAKSGAGGAGEVVLYKVQANWELMTPLLAPLFTRGVMPLVATIAVRNEPWNVNQGNHTC